MILFDTTNPYPLLPDGSQSYPEAQAHARAVDLWLGLRIAETEAALLHANQGSSEPERRAQWIGLSPDALLTPYTEIREILARLKPAAGSSIVDLGAGYGRMGFVIGAHYPAVRFLGYEVVPERVAEARRCLSRFSYPLVEIIQADLADPKFSPAAADYYFLYDYSNRQAIEKTLEDLKKVARDRSITVIGRGRSVRDIIEYEQPWLAKVRRPEHFPHYSIYRS